MCPTAPLTTDGSGEFPHIHSEIFVLFTAPHSLMTGRTARCVPRARVSCIQWCTVAMWLDADSTIPMLGWYAHYERSCAYNPLPAACRLFTRQGNIKLISAIQCSHVKWKKTYTPAVVCEYMTVPTCPTLMSCFSHGVRCIPHLFSLRKTH